eukprot:1435178-Pleurochrysis_carterae.AAC.1
MNTPIQMISDAGCCEGHSGNKQTRHGCYVLYTVQELDSQNLRHSAKATYSPLAPSLGRVAT